MNQIIINGELRQDEDIGAWYIVENTTGTTLKLKYDREFRFNYIMQEYGGECTVVGKYRHEFRVHDELQLEIPFIDVTHLLVNVS